MAATKWESTKRTCSVTLLRVCKLHGNNDITGKVMFFSWSYWSPTGGYRSPPIMWPHNPDPVGAGQRMGPREREHIPYCAVAMHTHAHTHTLIQTHTHTLEHAQWKSHFGKQRNPIYNYLFAFHVVVYTNFTYTNWIYICKIHCAANQNWLAGGLRGKKKTHCWISQTIPNQQQPQHKKTVWWSKEYGSSVCVRVLFVCFGPFFTVRTQLNTNTAMGLRVGGELLGLGVWLEYACGALSDTWGTQSLEQLSRFYVSRPRLATSARSEWLKEVLVLRQQPITEWERARAQRARA